MKTNFGVFELWKQSYNGIFVNLFILWAHICVLSFPCQTSSFLFFSSLPLLFPRHSPLHTHLPLTQPITLFISICHSSWSSSLPSSQFLSTSLQWVSWFRVVVVISEAQTMEFIELSLHLLGEIKFFFFPFNLVGVEFEFEIWVWGLDFWDVGVGVRFRSMVWLWKMKFWFGFN